MKAFSYIWNQVKKSKKFRESFVTSQFKKMVPFQIAVLRKKAGLSQEELAKACGLTQGVISRAEDPNYGNLTVNTILRIANGFNMGFKGEFVPISELIRWVDRLSEKSIQFVPLEKEIQSESKVQPTLPPEVYEGLAPSLMIIKFPNYTQLVQFSPKSDRIVQESSKPKVVSMSSFRKPELNQLATGASTILPRGKTGT